MNCIIPWLCRPHERTVPPDDVIRVIRGQRCVDERELFQEFAAAFQFPYYFGHNWDALDECLGDLDWLPGATYIVVITNSDRVLSSSPGSLPILCRVLTNARS